MLMDYPLPRPTTASPGSSAKLEIMTWRAANSQQLFHPSDSRECTRLQGQRTRRHSETSDTVSAALEARDASIAEKKLNLLR